MSSISSLQTPPGYPEFVKPDPKYNCLLCNRILREAVQTTCGHRACESCLTQYFEGKDEPVPCPAQEEDCDPQYKNDIVPDRSVGREIRVLYVYCTYKHFGCTEQVKWKDLEGHVAKCEYRPVECPNKIYGCNLTIPKALLEEHVNKQCNHRLVSCGYCKTMIPISKLEDHEINECNSAPLRCRYGCDTSFSSRQELSQHLEVCPVKPLDCKYKVIGCTFVGNENEMINHISQANDEHLEKITIYVRKMELESLTLKGQIQN